MSVYLGKYKFFMSSQLVKVVRGKQIIYESHVVNLKIKKPFKEIVKILSLTNKLYFVFINEKITSETVNGLKIQYSVL